ncbi:hypothetical protein LINPERHAP1_LOCUS22954 [Linum perenne]
MVRMVDQHKSFTAMRDVICPTILEQIEWTKIEVRTCVIQPSLDDVLQCTDHGRGFVVDLRRSRCTCGYWQLSGVPCLHGTAAMSYMRYDIKGYVDRLSWLRKLTQRAFHHYLDVRIGLKLRAYRYWI